MSPIGFRPRLAEDLARCDGMSAILNEDRQFPDRHYQTNAIVVLETRVGKIEVRSPVLQGRLRLQFLGARLGPSPLSLDRGTRRCQDSPQILQARDTLALDTRL